MLSPSAEPSLHCMFALNRANEWWELILSLEANLSLLKVGMGSSDFLGD